MFAIKNVKDAKFVAAVQAYMLLNESYFDYGNCYYMVVHLPVYAHPSENKDIVQAYVKHPNIANFQAAQVGIKLDEVVDTSEVLRNRTKPVKLSKSGKLLALPFLIPTKLISRASDVFVSFSRPRSNNLEISFDKHYQDIFERCLNNTYSNDTLGIFKGGDLPSYRDFIKGFAAVYLGSQMRCKPYSADATQIRWTKRRAWKKFIKAL